MATLAALKTRNGYLYFGWSYTQLSITMKEKGKWMLRVIGISLAGVKFWDKQSTFNFFTSYFISNFEHYISQSLAFFIFY